MQIGECFKLKSQAAPGQFATSNRGQLFLSKHAQGKMHHDAQRVFFRTFFEVLNAPHSRMHVPTATMGRMGEATAREQMPGFAA